MDPADPDDGPAAAEADAPAARLRRYRPLIALAAMGLVIGAAWAAGLPEVTSVEALRMRMEGAGAVGVVVFLALFVAAAFTGIPGLPFVLAAMVSYDPAFAFAISWGGGLMFASLGFSLARWAGGSHGSANSTNRVMRFMLRLVETRPLLCVIGLRVLFFLGPPVAYMLALTKLPFRTHLVGTAIGILPHLFLMTWSLELWLG